MTKNKTKERWRQINHPRYGKINFDVSSHGRIRRRSTGKIQRLQRSRRSYSMFKYEVHTPKRVGHTIYVAPCVARAFKRPPRWNEQVDHRDRNKDNNHNGNLRWVTQSKNIKLSYQRGGRKYRTGPIFSAESVELLTKLVRDGRWSRVKIAAAASVSEPTLSKLYHSDDRKRYGDRAVKINWKKLGADPKQFAA
jgi:hypothetical protein